MQRMERTNTIGIIILGLITHDIAAVEIIFNFFSYNAVLGIDSNLPLTQQ